MDIASQFGDYGTELKFDDLPAEVVDCAKKLVLDTLAAIIAGSTGDKIESLANIAREWGGKPESSILIYGDKIPTPHAGLVNAAMGRAREFDEFHEKAIIHSASTIVPTCLAIAESVGGINGKDFITSVVLGMDIMHRLGLSLKKNPLVTGITITQHSAAFATSVVAGRLLGLNRKEMINALGIAYSQVAGNVQCAIEGSVMVGFGCGFAARSGIFSATLAKRGIDGPQEVFQGKFGYFPVVHQNEYDPSIVTRDLGKRFEILNGTIKVFPGALNSFAAITAMFQMAKEERIGPQDVDQIQARVNQGDYNIVCHPLESKRNPSSPKAALYSLPYAVGAALVRGHVFLDDYTPGLFRTQKSSLLLIRLALL